MPDYVSSLGIGPPPVGTATAWIATVASGQKVKQFHHIITMSLRERQIRESYRAL